MHKNIDILLLLSAAVLVCIILPLRCAQRRTAFLKEKQAAYEADYLAWEIQTFQAIDCSVLPSAALEFYCYNEDMEQTAILYASDTLDFTPYFCVIFTHQGEKRGVFLES